MQARIIAKSALAVLSLVACGPPRASQFVGQDGSRDWWTVQCRGDEDACWTQAKAACQGDFDVHAIRARGASQPMTLAVRGGVVPSGTAIADHEIVISCTAPTVPAEAIAGPECRTSPPRPNHCEDADGETFRTGRTYLPPSAEPPPDPTVDAKAAEVARAELEGLAKDLGPELDALKKPIADVPLLLKSLTDLPRTFRLKPARVKAPAREVLAGGEATLSADITPAAKEDVAAFLTQLKATRSALVATPDNVAALLQKTSNRAAKVAELSARAMFALQAAARSGNVDVAAKAKADLAELPALSADVSKKLDDVKAALAELEAAASAAMAKLEAAAR